MPRTNHNVKVSAQPVFPSQDSNPAPVPPSRMHERKNVHIERHTGVRTCRVFWHEASFSLHGEGYDTWGQMWPVRVDTWILWLTRPQHPSTAEAVLQVDTSSRSDTSTFPCSLGLSLRSLPLAPRRQIPAGRVRAGRVQQGDVVHRDDVPRLREREHRTGRPERHHRHPRPYHASGECSSCTTVVLITREGGPRGEGGGGNSRKRIFSHHVLTGCFRDSPRQCVGNTRHLVLPI